MIGLTQSRKTAALSIPALTLVRISVVFLQVHPVVQARNFVAIAVEGQGLALEELAQAPLSRLAPARMVDGRIYVGVEAVLVGVGQAPGGWRLLFRELDLDDRLDALESVLPRHHQPDGRAILIGQHL